MSLCRRYYRSFEEATCTYRPYGGGAPQLLHTLTWTHADIFFRLALSFQARRLIFRTARSRIVGKRPENNSIRRLGMEKPDHRNRLLRPRHHRPHRHSPDQRYELPPPHSITSSARASSVGAIARPSALTVRMLITNSKRVGCSTGRSPALAPLRIFST